MWTCVNFCVMCIYLELFETETINTHKRHGGYVDIEDVLVQWRNHSSLLLHFHSFMNSNKNKIGDVKISLLRCYKLISKPTTRQRTHI